MNLTTPRTIIIQEVGKYLDNILGDKFTGWSVFFSWDGEIIEMDENNLMLLTRLQTTEHKDGFLHHVRTADYV